MKVVVQEAPFDAYAEVQKYQAENLPAGKHGGTVVFVGTMRDFNEGVDGIAEMYLDHYPGMTEKHLEHVCEDAFKEWDIMDAFVMHRVGAIQPDDAIVLVAVWSRHRAMAFDACRFIINDLKHRAPFWKREKRPDGEHWVEGNTADDKAAKVNSK
jgi:molybdopterin synthase catalytic subunit